VSTLVNGHSLKLHFCMFKRSERKHNSFFLSMFVGIFSINCKVYMLKVKHKSNFVLHVQNTQTSRMDSFCFFQTFFFKPNVHHSFWKLERILTLMIRRAKGLELMNFFYNPFEHICFKIVFDLKNYGFWKCGFNKSSSYICDRRHQCIIYMIWNQLVIKMYFYIKCSVKKGIWNTKF